MFIVWLHLLALYTVSVIVTRGIYCCCCSYVFRASCISLHLWGLGELEPNAVSFVHLISWVMIDGFDTTCVMFTASDFQWYVVHMTEHSFRLSCVHSFRLSVVCLFLWLNIVFELTNLISSIFSLYCWELSTCINFIMPSSRSRDPYTDISSYIRAGWG
jgi:hypothetical protein